MKLTHQLATAAILSATLLSGCGGGGGGDGGSTEPTPARGSYDVTFNNGRSGGLVVLSDGTFWGVYSAVGNDAVIAGLIQGSGTTNGSGFTSGNGRDFSFEGNGVSNFSVNSQFEEMASFAGTASYATGNVTFAGTYDDTFDDTPSLAAVAGSYTGQAANTGGIELASFSINGAGAFSGSGASGCTFSGSLTPRTDGNVFNVAITFNGGVCLFGTSTIRGIAVYEPESAGLLVAVVNGSRTDGGLFLGFKS